MKTLSKVVLTALFLALSVVMLNAQNQEVTTIEKGLFKQKVFVKCGIELTSAQVVKLIAEDPNLEKYAKPVAMNYLGSTLLYATGYTLILIPITQAIFEHEDPNWNLAYIGAGCVLVSIPLKNAYNKKAQQAFDYYNAGYKETSSLQLKSSRYGIGIAMNF